MSLKVLKKQDLELAALDRKITEHQEAKSKVGSPKSHIASGSDIESPKSVKSPNFQKPTISSQRYHILPEYYSPRKKRIEERE